MFGPLHPAGMRLATRVVLAAAVLLLLLLIIVVVTYDRASDDRRRAEVDNAVATGQAIAGMIDGFARDLQTTTMATAAYLSELDEVDQERAGPLLSEVADDYGLVRGFFVVDESGTVVASATGSGIGMDTSGRPYFAAVNGGAPTVWTEAVEALDSDQIIVTFARRIDTHDGELRGYLVASFDPPAIAERLADRVPEDADVTLVDHLGGVLHSTSRPELAGTGSLSSNTPAVAEIQVALDGALARVDGAFDFLDGEPRFGAVAPVPTTGWAVAVTRPLAPLEASLRDRFIQQALLIGAAMLAAGLLLTLATHRIARPLGELARAAEAVERGERPQIPRVEGQGEVSRLAAAVHAMNEAVAEREDALQAEAERRRVLSEASSAFIEAGLDVDNQLDTLARLVAETLGDGCAIRLLSADELELPLTAVHHPSPEALEAAREILGGQPLPYGEGFPWQAVLTGEPQIASDSRERVIEQMPRVHRSYFEQYGIASVISVPLRAHGRAIGALTAWSGDPRRLYTEADADLLQQIADRAGLTIENAQLYRRASEYAEAVERAMAAHQELLAIVSHDLKNPLAMVKGTAQLINRRLERGDELGPGELQEAMEGIRDAVDRATNEIDASLDMARIDMGHTLTLSREPTDLVALLRRICRDQQQLTDAHEVRLETAVAELVGEWDARRLERAFVNLVNNAIKFSPDGGAIELTVGEEDGFAVVTVRDHGVGIPDHAVPRIFDRFYRAENVADRIAGTGLGLSGVRSIVEGHGGSISVESEEGAGTLFTVRLPLAQPRGDGDRSPGGRSRTSPDVR